MPTLQIRRNALGLILCFCCFFCVFLHAKGKRLKIYKGSKNKLHIYLLIGQSNMAGRAPFTKEEVAIIKKCYLLNNEDKLQPANNPLNRYSTIRKGLGMQKMNPGYMFAKTMLKKNKDISLGLVVNAKGGSQIKQWEKGTHFYKEAVRRVRVAQKIGTLKGILWHQGESDKTNAHYLAELKTLVANLRNDFDMPKLPFVAGQVNNLKLINDQIAKLPEAVAFTGFTSSAGLTAMDRWHFDAKSMRLLGERYAEAMLKIQTKQKAK